MEIETNYTQIKGLSLYFFNTRIKKIVNLYNIRFLFGLDLNKIKEYRNTKKLLLCFLQ